MKEIRSPKFTVTYLLLVNISRSQEQKTQFICVYEEPRIQIKQICNFLSSLSIKLTRAAGARINGKSFIELEMDGDVDLVDMKKWLTEYQSIRSGMGSFQVFACDESNTECKRFKIASENNLIIPCSLSKLSASTSSLIDSDSMLDYLESLLDVSGFLDLDKVSPSSPRPKSNLIFSELNEANAPIFCLDAVNVIVENITFSLTNPDSLFRAEKFDACIQNLHKISARKDLESAIGFALLVHASKCKSPRRLFSLSRILAFRNLSIVAAPSIYEEASKLLDEPHIKKILLHGTGLDESALMEIRTVFVSFPDSDLRGWCGPSMIIINVDGLRDTYHLENPAAMAALAGHETRHAVLRKWLGNDVNFSSPTKPHLTSHPNVSASKGNRESGLWFELCAIGEKFTYSKNDVSTVELAGELMKAILEGWRAGRAPALNEEQVRGFWDLLAPHNQEAAFEYVERHIIE